MIEIHITEDETVQLESIPYNSFRKHNASECSMHENTMEANMHLVQQMGITQNAQRVLCMQ